MSRLLTSPITCGPRPAPIALAFGLLLAAAPALAEEEPQVYGRISALEGELKRLSPEGGAPVGLSLNDLVQSGDRLQTGASTFAEIELLPATFFRLAPSSIVSVVRLEPTPELSVVQGAVIVSRSSEPPEASLHTATLRVAAQPGALLRVDQDPFAPSLAVRAVRGAASVEGEQGSRVVAAPERVTYARGEVKIDRLEAEDAFDRWSSEREALVREARVPEALAGARYQGSHDLHGNGQWILIDGQWWWRPSVADSWAPYSDGYWAWYDVGWTWVPYTRWGFVTHHYGRWIYLSGHGWCWTPHHVWSPAWVTWVAYDGYIGWAPCDWHCGAVSRRHYPRHHWAVATYFSRDYATAPADRSRPFVHIDPERIDDSKVVAVTQPRTELAPSGRSGVGGARQAGPVLAEMVRRAKPEPAPRAAARLPEVAGPSRETARTVRPELRPQPRQRLEPTHAIAPPRRPALVPVRPEAPRITGPRTSPERNVSEAPRARIAPPVVRTAPPVVRTAPAVRAAPPVVRTAPQVRAPQIRNTPTVRAAPPVMRQPAFRTAPAMRPSFPGAFRGTPAPAPAPQQSVQPPPKPATPAPAAVPRTVPAKSAAKRPSKK